MPDRPRLLAFAGSVRRGSWNRMLLDLAIADARSAGAEVTHLDLRETPLPLYDGDLEAAEGLPEHARTIKDLMKSHDGFLIASPEYNSSVTPLLKNAIDWASRREGDEPALVCFRGKTAGLVSASTGALGGLRGLFHLRDILLNIGTHVIPTQHAVPRAPEVFDEAGGLTAAAHRKGVARVAEDLVRATRALAQGAEAD